MTATTTATTAWRSEGLSREILVLAGVVISSGSAARSAPRCSRSSRRGRRGRGVRVRRGRRASGAFGTTFWAAAGLIALAVVPALLLPRPRQANEANANADSGAAADAAVGGEQAKAA
jgi:hypothetical protein